MFNFDSLSDFFVSGDDSDIDSNSFLEGYQLDLSEEGFKCEVLFLIKIHNLNPELSLEFSDLLVDNFRSELLNSIKNDPYLAFESALRSVNKFYNEFFDSEEQEK